MAWFTFIHCLGLGSPVHFSFLEIVPKELGYTSEDQYCFSSQTDGQAQRTIQTVEDILRAYVIYFKGSWDDQLTLIEFSYNNSYHSSIGMAPFEALYGRICRSLVWWFEVGESSFLVPEIIHEVVEKFRMIRD